MVILKESIELIAESFLRKKKKNFQCNVLFNSQTNRLIDAVLLKESIESIAESFWKNKQTCIAINVLFNSQTNHLIDRFF